MTGKLVIIPILQIRALRHGNYTAESLSLNWCENQVAYIWFGIGFKSQLSLLLTLTSGTCLCSLNVPIEGKDPRLGRLWNLVTQCLQKCPVGVWEV